MDHLDIEASLRKVDRKFTEQLSNEERRRAVKEFKLIYAEEMAKLTTDIVRKQKLMDNINNLSVREMTEAKEFDQELRKKMDKHIANRDKQQQSRQKELKMGDENWKRKLDEIVRKNKEKEREAFRKGEKIRKEAEQYWNKKHEVQKEEKDEKEEQKTETLKVLTNPTNPSDKAGLQPKKKDKYSQTKFNSIKPNDTKLRLLPDLNKTKINKMDNKPLNQSFAADNSRGSEAKTQFQSQRERSIKTNLERQEENFQKIMSKLDKIQQTRQNVQHRIEKEVQQSKRIREMKQNPQYLAANRQKSINQLHINKSKSKTKQLASKSKSKSSLKDTLTNSRSRLDESLSKHLQTKKKLSQQEFAMRENVYENKMRKIKQGKITRLIKDAISMIKHDALKQE